MSQLRSTTDAAAGLNVHSSGMTSAHVTERRRPTAIRASWLFDGTSSTLISDPVLIIDGQQIAAVDRAVAPPDGMDIIDLDGATLLPGLIDTHFHLAFDAGTDPVASLAARDDDAALAAMAVAGRAALYGGITTVRDLGDRGYLSLRLPGADLLPTVVTAGPPITTPGGHCHFLGGVAAPGVDGIRAAVREHADRGVNVIKIMASGGTLTPGTRQELAQFTREELQAAVDEAHRCGLPVTAHAHGTAAIANAVAAGVDGMEHVTFWSAEGIDSPDDLLRLIADRRIVVGVTAGIAPVPGATPPPAVVARLPHIIANLRRLYEAGAPMAIGTDAGIGPGKPHDVLRHATVQVDRLGIEPAEALRTVTSTAAAICGLAHRKGRLAPGYDADILAVEGDPLTDPAAIHRIRAVFARGTAVR